MIFGGIEILKSQHFLLAFLLHFVYLFKMLNFRQENIEVQNHPFHVLCTDLNSVGASGHFFTFFIAAAELINHDNPKNLIAGAVARFEIYEDPGQFIRDPASCRIEDASVHVEYDLIANTNKKKS